MCVVPRQERIAAAVLHKWHHICESHLVRQRWRSLSLGGCCIANALSCSLPIYSQQSCLLDLELHSAFNKAVCVPSPAKVNFSTRFNFAKKVQSFAREGRAFYWLFSLSIAARRQASEIRSNLSCVRRRCRFSDVNTFLVSSPARMSHPALQVIELHSRVKTATNASHRCVMSNHRQNEKLHLLPKPQDSARVKGACQKLSLNELKPLVSDNIEKSFNFAKNLERNKK